MILFLTEEPSAKEFLETLIPRFFNNLDFKVKSFRGKQDLVTNLKGIIDNWRKPNTVFVILHDKDGADCIQLKDKLLKECGDNQAIVRIVCNELESWYWGDLESVERALNARGLSKLKQKQAFRIPDKIENPKNELRKRTAKYEQISGARAIAREMDIERNDSHSFKVFIESVKILNGGGLHKIIQSK